MSTTFGPPLVLAGPLPSPLPYGLFSVATIIPEPDERWAQGGRVRGYPPGPAHVFDPCAAGTFRVKEENDETPFPLFAGFTVYLKDTCQARGIGTDSALEDMVSRSFAAVEQYAVEQEFAKGLLFPTNPYLADGDAEILASGAPVSALEGLALLELAIGHTGRAGVIHADRGVASAWGMGGGFMVSGDRLLTSLGTPVAAGGGYEGIDPDSGATASGDQGWAFATGPVEIRRSSSIELLPGTLAEALDRSTNQIAYYAERNYLVDWDTQLQAAVLVDRSL